jgi:hypothetical protein
LTEAPFLRLNTHSPQFYAVSGPAAGNIDILVHPSGVMPVQGLRQALEPAWFEIEEPAIDLPCDLGCTRAMKGVMPLVVAPTVVQERKDSYKGSVCFQFIGKHFAVGEDSPPVRRTMDAAGAKCEAAFRLPKQPHSVHLAKLDHSVFCSETRRGQDNDCLSITQGI